jgi:hypothetical protein
MRIIGNRKNWSETELDPGEAYRRGRALDAMLRSAIPAPRRGVYRGTFEFFVRLDAARALAAARRINHG